MNFKLSHIALAFVASVSFYAAAENVVPGSEMVGNADVAVRQDSQLSLTINPVVNLTVADIKKGRSTNVAKFKVSGGMGSNTAVRLLNASNTHPHCAYIFGSSDKTNKLEVCLSNSVHMKDFVENGNTYFILGDGEYDIRGGADNINPNLTSVGADSYNMAMELVQYTL
ncbi:hypothetical protein ACET8I_12255 [Aeromonas veronii]